MTLSEFNKAKQEDSCFVVQVKKHKTFTAHGPASVGTAEVFLALSARPTKASDVYLIKGNAILAPLLDKQRKNTIQQLCDKVRTE